jgi:hypothetical protein
MKKKTTTTLALEWCQDCGAYVSGCDHQPNGLTQLAHCARQVEKGARAAGTLLDGVSSAIRDAASILGGRFK